MSAMAALDQALARTERPAATAGLSERLMGLRAAAGGVSVCQKLTRDVQVAEENALASRAATDLAPLPQECLAWLTPLGLCEPAHEVDALLVTLNADLCINGLQCLGDPARRRAWAAAINRRRRALALLLCFDRAIFNHPHWTRTALVYLNGDARGLPRVRWSGADEEPDFDARLDAMEAIYLALELLFRQDCPQELAAHA